MNFLASPWVNFLALGWVNFLAFLRLRWVNFLVGYTWLPRDRAPSWSRANSNCRNPG